MTKDWKIVYSRLFGRENMLIDDPMYLDTKKKIVDIMFGHTAKYASKEAGRESYSKCGYILIEVLQDCLNEAKAQMKVK
jgi:hypothetical protein